MLFTFLKHCLSLCKQKVNYKETKSETLNRKFPGKDELNLRHSKYNDKVQHCFTVHFPPCTVAHIGSGVS